MTQGNNVGLRQWFSEQFALFLLAVGFLTRIPIPANTPYSEQKLNQSNRFFSLVGLAVGVLLSLSYLLFATWFSPTISIVLVLIVSLMLTGAFHEDGLADMVDGIGGGYTVEKRLAIMKDSRIGTYGTCALVCNLLLKALLLIALAEISTGLLVSALILAHALSRAIAASLLYDMDYVADLDKSKSKPLAQGQSKAELLFLLCVGLTPLILIAPSCWLYLIALCLVFRVAFKVWLNKRLGGYTGDCLGAAQQLSELVILLVLLANYSTSTI